MNFHRFILASVLFAAAATVSISQAQAHGSYGSGAEFAIACENGGNYVLRAGPVTDSGDVVTGHLYLRPDRGMHVRLIPMGDGYRYAGKGVWLDGIRDRAWLYFSKNRRVACQVSAV